MQEVLYIVFGWGLGLLSTLFVNLVRNHGRKTRFRQGLCVELREAVPFLVGMYYLLKSRLGQVDRDALTWTHSMYLRFDPGVGKVLESIEKLMKRPDEELEKALTLRSEESKRESVGVSKLALPFLQQNLSCVSLLTPEAQRIVAHVQRNIRTLNDQIEDYDYWSKKTFDSSLSQGNYSIVESNVAHVSQAIANLSYKTAQLISRMISDLGN